MVDGRRRLVTVGNGFNNLALLDFSSVQPHAIDRNWLPSTTFPRRRWHSHLVDNRRTVNTRRRRSNVVDGISTHSNVVDNVLTSSNAVDDVRHCVDGVSVNATEISPDFWDRPRGHMLLMACKRMRRRQWERYINRRNMDTPMHDN